MMPRMGRARVYRGRMVQGERPEWGPLREVVGEEVMGDFMWMYEVELTDGPPVHAYKHIDTRRYAHLAAGGAAFVCEPPGRYRRFSAADVFAEVFEHLPLLAGVTDEQIAASRAVLERLNAGD
jgi:hypothetical protein